MLVYLRSLQSTGSPNRPLSLRARCSDSSVLADNKPPATRPNPTVDPKRPEQRQCVLRWKKRGPEAGDNITIRVQDSERGVRCEACGMYLWTSSIRGARRCGVRATAWGLFVWYDVNAGLIAGPFQRHGNEATPQGLRREVEIDFDDLLRRRVDQAIDQLLGGVLVVFVRGSGGEGHECPCESADGEEGSDGQRRNDVCNIWGARGFICVILYPRERGKTSATPSIHTTIKLERYFPSATTTF